MIKFYSKKEKQPYKVNMYEQWDDTTNSYWRENHIKIWMSRNSTEYLLCLGFWTLVAMNNTLLKKVKFKAADPHWVTIDLSSASGIEKEEFKQYLIDHNVKWF